MKKIIRRLKHWLIGKLGGYTQCDMVRILASSLDAQFKEIKSWKKTVRELCRRSDSSYYDWACEYCTRTCDKRNGWCERFYPHEEKMPHEEGMLGEEE